MPVMNSQSTNDEKIEKIKRELALGGGASLPNREDIPKEYRWKLEDIYPSDEAWEEDFKKVQELIPKLSSFAGTLGESPEQMLKYFKFSDDLEITLGKLIVFAHMRSHEDTSVSKNQLPVNRISSLSVQYSSAVSFVTPEILEIPEERLSEFIADKSLADYAFNLREILRGKKHVLSRAEEAIMAQTGEIAGTSDSVFSMLTNADMKFGSIKNEQGEKVELSEERAVSYLRSTKRSVRKKAFEALYKPYAEMKNTLGATFNGMLKTAKFQASVRKYQSPLAAALEIYNIPESVYSSLVDTIESNLEPMYRYMKLRKEMLGVKRLHMYDIYAPLAEDPFGPISWSEGIEMMFDALRPLGGPYLAQVREGLEGGWIDVFNNKGKRSGGYSWGTYGTHPYIFLNYTNRLEDVSTLVHEMGHSMHSFYSRANQPYTTAEYCIFTAEVASTTNEVLLLSRMLETASDKKKRLFLLNRRLENIRTTVYRQTMFASFEREVHKREALGEDTTPDALCALWYDLNRKYYGEEIVIDEPLKMEWARIPHFYTPFYVYQYATGFSAATALATGILRDGEPARDKYLNFLTKGGSDYPIEILKQAGADMSTPAPVKEVVRIFGETVKEMTELLEK